MNFSECPYQNLLSLDLNEFREGASTTSLGNKFQVFTTLQQDLNKLQTWAKDSGMKFNAKKCYLLSSRTETSNFYTINDQFLKQVQDNPYLGLTISDNLKWKTHMDNICKKANSTLGFLRRNLHHCRKPCRKMPT